MLHADDVGVGAADRPGRRHGAVGRALPDAPTDLGPVGTHGFRSSIAATSQTTDSSAACTASIRSLVNVAMPQRREAVETKAMRIEPAYRGG